ncbi:hypothetical protein FANTH_207 [Fusarium anthophilum]|uniref:Uncharacterized protein n=1 Tax=Fusarium anthophilum TaxID=48485 RepID=A0A8H5ECM6_9HYPO|nr:hypothetical protein FANTH_207 [Fusarium anthophilum]
MDDYTSALQQHIDLKNLITKYLASNCDLESKGEALREEYIETRTKFNNAAAAFTTAVKDYEAKLSSVTDCGKTLKKCQEKIRSLEEEIQSQNKLIFSGFVNVFGIPCTRKWLQEQQDLSTTQHPSDDTSPETAVEQAEASPTRDTVISCLRSLDGLPPPVSRGTSTENRGSESNHPCIQEKAEKNAHPTGHRSSNAEPIFLPLPEKRHLSSPQLPPTKRHRAKGSQTLVTPPEKSVEFRELYRQRGNKRKYTIVYYIGAWYIFKCDDHKEPQCFTSPDPLRGASRHLSSKHQLCPADYGVVIKKSGIKVLNCTQTLAKLYNAGLVLKKTNPKPGEVYKTRCDGNRRTYAISVLPWRMDKKVSSLIVEETGLFDDIPDCYEYNQSTHTVRWSYDYDREGIYEQAREYPVMYFDDAYTSENCNVSWLPLCDFQEYNSSDTDVYNQITVKDFIRSTGAVSIIEDKPVGPANRAFRRFWR